MTKFVIKRAYEPPSGKDGIRILVDRLWPRGLRKDAAALDLWAKDLAPAPSLRQWFDHRPERFAEFKRRYRDELKGNRAIPEVLGQIGKAKATLLYAARDPAVNHAAVLAEFLNKSRQRKPGSRPASAGKAWRLAVGKPDNTAKGGKDE